MEQNHLKELLDKYAAGQCTEQELALLESWYLNLNNNNRSELSEDELQQAEHRMWTGLNVKTNPKTHIVWLRMAVAASILLLLSFGTYVLFLQKEPLKEQYSRDFKNDVNPGGNAATLTLSNGKIVVLDTKVNGKLATEGNMEIVKLAGGKINYRLIKGTGSEPMENTLVTHPKEQFQLSLADGTNVWLNASSSIKYPTDFTGKYREVTVTGEAYFEVAHQASHPFRVISSGQTIEVLGTHFNVNTYPDEPTINTTLLQGSVKVINGSSFKIIKPGEQAVLKDGELVVNRANSEEAIAWKNGYFRFNQERIESIMRKLSRWYNIDVEFDGPVPDDQFSGTISRFKNISAVLKALEYYQTVHFKIEGRRVIVSK